jgi:signal transduction histidine kinase
VEVTGGPVGDLGDAVEAAAYFVTAESLTNVAKYAHAGAAFVHVCVEDGCLQVEIRDDGVGGAELSPGGGLSGLRDRVDALHGRFEVDSPPGGGTSVTVEIPLARP